MLSQLGVAERPTCSSNVVEFPDRICAECGRCSEEVGQGGRAEQAEPHEKELGGRPSTGDNQDKWICVECWRVWLATGEVSTPRQRRHSKEGHPSDINDPKFYNGADKGEVDLLREYTHDASGTRVVNCGYTIHCGGWDLAPPSRKQLLVAETEGKLRKHGFVVLEGLLSADWCASLEGELCTHFNKLPRGFCSIPLRARREQTVLPWAPPWNEDRLACHELIVEVAVRYVVNNKAAVCRTEEARKDAFVEWVADNGASAAYFLQAPREEQARPFAYMLDAILTPPCASPQSRHRDIQLPGPFASLHVHVPVTPLTPENGPIGFVPGSHLTQTPNIEVVACPPLGSVVLYDSFCEHRGCENTTVRTRYALNAMFNSHDVWTGFWPYMFGRCAWRHTLAFRRYANTILKRALAAVPGRVPELRARCSEQLGLAACATPRYCIYFAQHEDTWCDHLFFCSSGIFLRKGSLEGRWQLLTAGATTRTLPPACVELELVFSGRVDPGPLQRRDDVAYAIAAYLEACLRSAGYRLGLRAPVVAAAATGSGAIPPAWPIKIQFQEIMHKVDEASRWNRTAFVVCAGHAQEADTFLSYRGFTTIDACAIVRDVFLTKESTIADVRKLLHKQLLDSMRCGLPLHIAMSSSALDFKGTICKDYVFPASLFNTSLFRKPLEYSKVLSDDDRRGWALNIVDRMKSDFFVLITTDMDIANATAYLADAVPYLDDAALIELDPSSFEAEFRAMEARKSERLSAKYGQRASDNVG